MWDGGWRGLRRVERTSGAPDGFISRSGRAGFNLREVHGYSVGLLEERGSIQVVLLSFFASPTVSLARGHRNSALFIHTPSGRCQSCVIFPRFARRSGLGCQLFSSSQISRVLFGATRSSVKEYRKTPLPLPAVS